PRRRPTGRSRSRSSARSCGGRWHSWTRRSRPSTAQRRAGSSVLGRGTKPRLALALALATAAPVAAAAVAATPVAGTWRALPPAPILPDPGAVGAWTGKEMVVFGAATTRQEDGAVLKSAQVAAAYSPATNTWRRLSPPAATGSLQGPFTAAWTGKEVLLWGPFLDEAYNPAARRWRALPHPRIAPLPAPRGGARAVWDGREVLVVGGVGVPSGLAYNPAANRWRTLPRMESTRLGFAAVWTGKKLLLWGGQAGSPSAPSIPAHGLAYDPAANGWSPLPPAPILGRPGPTAVWTGRQMIVWGGGQSPPAFADGAAFTPTAA